MGLATRLRTIAGTVLATSMLWVAGLIWWSGQIQPSPERATPTSSAVTGSPPLDQTMIAYRPQDALEADTPKGANLIIPVQGVQPGQLSDTFSQARANGARVHDAIDIMAPRGTPVLAATGGTVEKLFNSAAGGTTIYVRSPDRRFIYYYAHLDHYAPGLHEGQQLRQGELIGAVGSTGNASPDGPHLHFAIQVTTPEAKWYEPSTAINPYPLLTGR
ncbi:MAG: M23 family metallopeptidase [Novosphingobium sp.]